MTLLITILFLLAFANWGLNVWAMQRQGDWSFFDEAKFWYGYPLWLEQLIAETKPGSPQRIGAFVGLAIGILVALSLALSWLTG